MIAIHIETTNVGFKAQMNKKINALIDYWI